MALQTESITDATVTAPMPQAGMPALPEVTSPAKSLKRGVRIVEQSAGSRADPPSGLWAARHLIGLMVHRDFIGRYRGSLLGAFWPLINPLGHLILYTFLFCVVLKVKLGTDPSMSNFALYLMAGLLPWGSLSEALSRSTTTILESPNLVKRVVFPLETLPSVLVISSMLSELVALTILFAATILCFHKVNATVLFLPLIVASQVLLMAGLSWLLSSLGVFVRDFRHIMALALQAWMYSTPIVYPPTALPANLQFLLWINPMAGIVCDYRHVLLDGRAPDWGMYVAYTLTSAIIAVAGYTFFMRTKKSFADVI
jgi:lipopolysaccharide transport system permease protein